MHTELEIHGEAGAKSTQMSRDSAMNNSASVITGFKGNTFINFFFIKIVFLNVIIDLKLQTVKVVRWRCVPACR